jgi:hypothetical protein
VKKLRGGTATVRMVLAPVLLARALEETPQGKGETGQHLAAFQRLRLGQLGALVGCRIDLSGSRRRIDQPDQLDADAEILANFAVDLPFRIADAEDFHGRTLELARKREVF